MSYRITICDDNPQDAAFCAYDAVQQRLKYSEFSYMVIVTAVAEVSNSPDMRMDWLWKTTPQADSDT